MHGFSCLAGCHYHISRTGVSYGVWRMAGVRAACCSAPSRIRLGILQLCYHLFYAGEEMPHAGWRVVSCGIATVRFFFSGCPSTEVIMIGLWEPSKRIRTIIVQARVPIVLCRLLRISLPSFNATYSRGVPPLPFVASLSRLPCLSLEN